MKEDSTQRHRSVRVALASDIDRIPGTPCFIDVPHRVTHEILLLN